LSPMHMSIYNIHYLDGAKSTPFEARHDTFIATLIAPFPTSIPYSNVQHQVLDKNSNAHCLVLPWRLAFHHHLLVC
jgi:hypothetical protein